jgi:hypothetical protein
MGDFENQCEKMTSLTRTVGSCTKNVIRDNTFQYTDGVALLLHRTGEDLVENNLFSHIDYSAVGIGFGVSGFADAGTFRRNTLEWFGDSVGFRVGGEAWTVDLNYFSHLGLCQSDGAAVQAGQNTATNTIYSRNWAIDSAKKGFRFDMGEDGVEGFNGTMIRNVGVRTSMGMAVKGADHHIFHNLAFGSVKAHDDLDGGGANDISVLECYPCSATRGFYYTNHATVTRNNAGGYISGGQNEQQKHWLLDHDYYDHNYNEHVERTPIEQYLRDSSHLDFRPRQDSPLVDAGLPIVYNSDGSGYYLGREPVADQPFDGEAPDIGAYEHGASLSKYFIPGRIAMAPTHPIPQDSSVQVLPDLDLMFLGESHLTCTTYTLDSPKTPWYLLANLLMGTMFSKSGQPVKHSNWARPTFGVSTRSSRISPSLLAPCGVSRLLAGQMAAMISSIWSFLWTKTLPSAPLLKLLEESGTAT